MNFINITIYGEKLKFSKYESLITVQCNFCHRREESMYWLFTISTHSIGCMKKQSVCTKEKYRQARFYPRIMQKNSREFSTTWHFSSGLLDHRIPRRLIALLLGNTFKYRVYITIANVVLDKMINRIPTAAEFTVTDMLRQVWIHFVVRVIEESHIIHL